MLQPWAPLLQGKIVLVLMLASRAWIFAHAADTGQRETSTHIQRFFSSVLIDVYTGIQ